MITTLLHRAEQLVIDGLIGLSLGLEQAADRTAQAAHYLINTSAARMVEREMVHASDAWVIALDKDNRLIRVNLETQEVVALENVEQPASLREIVDALDG